MLDNHPRKQLRFIIEKYGRSIIDDPRRCRGMLKDLAPKHELETNLLMSVLDQKLVAELTQKTPTPILVHLDILAQRLHNNIGIQKEFAIWAIESWALALDVISQPSAQRIITPEPEPIPTIVKPEPKIIVPPKPASIIPKSTPIITTLPSQSKPLFQQKSKPIISVILIFFRGVVTVGFFLNTLVFLEFFLESIREPEITETSLLINSTIPINSLKQQKIGKFIVQDGVATDTHTGLMWLRFANGQQWENGTVAGALQGIKWADAMKIPAIFNQQGYANYKDWRVPTVEELKTLIEKPKYNDRLTFYIDVDVFPDRDQIYSFWSSSSSTYNNNYAWVVQFNEGYSRNFSKRDNYSRVLLVR